MNMPMILCGFFAGAAGAMGLGGGSVLIVALALFLAFDQIRAQGVNLLFFIPIALCGIVIYSKKRLIDWQKVWPLTAGGFIGALCGGAISWALPAAGLRKIFAAVLCALGLYELYKAVKGRVPSAGPRVKSGK